MEEVRQLVQEEGREARNLVAFHVAVDTPARVSRRPPRAGAPPPRRPAPRAATRLRSASAGRDKRSELRARYWALLFGDLQRAIGEIYNTVEAHENLNECQEVILVLENYTRDFKALGEWFRLKWEYDNTPPPQRPQSLAWEVRKTDFVRPESRRAHSVKSSPSVSGKNSPCLSGHNTPSGKNSPNLTGKASPASGKISPRVSSHSTSPKANLEFFSSKIVSKITTKPEPKPVKDVSRLFDIKEKEVKDINVSGNNGEESSSEVKETVTLDDEDNDKEGATELNIVNTSKEIKSDTENNDIVSVKETEQLVEIGKAKECANTGPKQVVIKSPKRIIPDTAINETLTSQAKATISNLEAMENEFLAKNLIENMAKNENLINKDNEENAMIIENTIIVDEMVKDQVPSFESTVSEEKTENNTNSDEKDSVSTESPVKSEDNFGDVSNESSTKSYDDKHININENTNEPETNTNDNDPAKVNDNTTEDKDISSVDVSKESSELISKDDNTSNDEAVTELKADLLTDTKQLKCNDTNDSIELNEPPKEILSDVKDSTENVTEKEETKKEDTKKSDKPLRPAYSQAAAKPKPITSKPEVKPPARLTSLTRSKTVVEIRPSPIKAQRVPKRNQTNKCSYPFNLTTGRTIFDTPNTKPLVRKPPNKVLASGDTKINQPKIDLKKRPPRPTSLKVNVKGDKNDKLNPKLENIKDCDEYSSSDTIVTQIDMSRIESSESLKTLVPEDLNQVTNSIEVLNVDKNDNEGWLTVKSRRLSRESKKSKSHWVNRFHQPSATTSLPTLNMIESPKQETNPIINDRAKSEQPQNIINKTEKVAKVTVKPKESKKNPSIIRQKSDVTGLKTRSAKNKSLKKEKMKEKENELIKNRLHSSLESLTTGLARSQESTQEVFDFDKWKAEFKTTFKYLDEEDQIPDHNEILKSADPSEMSEIAEMTSQIEENERKISLALDFQSEVDQRKLCEEEDLLNRQIMELQQVSDIDLDTETDDTETDAEILCEDSNTGERCQSPESLSCLTSSLEDQYETALAGMSWAERVDTLVALEALVARDPGRAQQLHAKLSQGIKRRGSFQDALRRLQAKQARAERQRLEYRTERAKKIHQLLARVEEVKVAKNQLIEEKRIRMERRLQKAAENRDQHLKDIVRKAHDEEEKLREIAFIKQLEAENRRHEFLDQCKSQNTRLRQMRRERLTKLEQKAAREAAVGARRQAIEAARKLHVETLLEKRKERDARVEELKEQKKQERDDAAREKAEGVKSRLSALALAAELEAVALRSRIRHKQDASQLRLESHLQAIREKATHPRQPPKDQRARNQIGEEKEKEEQRERRGELGVQFGERHEPSERKERFVMGDQSFIKFIDIKIHLIFKKMRLSLDLFCQKSQKTKEPETKSEKRKRKKNRESDAASSVCSSVSDMSRASERSELAPRPDIGVNCMERQLNELCRIIDKNPHDKSSFQKLNGLKILGKLMTVAAEREDLTAQFTPKSLTTAVNIISRVMAMSQSSGSYFISSNLCVHVVKLLSNQLEKDLRDPKETELTKQLSDCLAIGLDSVLCSTRLFSDAEEGLKERTEMMSNLRGRAHTLIRGFLLTKETELTKQLSDCLAIGLDSVLCSTRLFSDAEEGLKERTEMLSNLRGRAHTLISYICLCGCITRGEKAGEVRENIETLLTVSADLCQPTDFDVGSERASAVQSLRCALGTSVCGARGEFCMLFACGANLGKDGGLVNAARTAHLLRALAELDHQIVQDAFGEGGWPLEFRAAVARLLSQHAPNDKEAPRNSSRPTNQRLDQSLAETMVLDLIVLVGFVVVNNPQLLETICDGWSVIKTLCTLPANWLVSKYHCHALLPTLLAISEWPSAATAISSELSTQMLEEYMRSPAAQKVKLVQVIKQARAKKNSKK
ncbi:hypothetical protein K1T71_012425 [Dendrolimus kikuchii]|uniref:Uncharacterized protein n=1 Tax=Dendrolimus kikuchii TaxID=765133 RepID=A0ACC1CJB1_9NEOP|nr:hypothetical protein K1T71_012425 [Dendrolimus kikuchii]